MRPDWQNNYFLILFAAAILHSLYLALIVGVRSEKRSGQVWLSVTLLGISALLINYFIYISDAISQYPHLLNALVPLMYFTGPSFYFFIRMSENKAFQLRGYDLLHLLPILFITWESSLIFLQSAEEKLVAINTIFENQTPSVLEMVLGNRFDLISVAYALVCVYYLSSRIFVSSGKQLGRLNWLRKFSIALAILLMLSIIIPVLFMMLSINGAYIELTLTLMYAVSIHILGYVILKNQKGTPWTTSSGKYLTSPLDSDLLRSYKNQVLTHLEHSKPWLAPNFSIGDLSSQLAIPKHHLSQVLNEEINMSFIDLVNSYRVEAAKWKLASGALKKYSIVGIAMDCGFASKSTFNRIFKKTTGLTPTAYLPMISSKEPITPASS